ncbi:MAG: CRISPR-associated protein Cse1 family [Roseomonas sp.]|nr:CRISPR-associated protein Cse1 family [Roseomonas sp.]
MHRWVVLNLIPDSWLPVLRRSGRADVIRPAQIAEQFDDDPVIAIDWPRADFRFAALEFLIGLLATTFPPAEHDDWLDGWDRPPAPKVLDAAFAPFAHAFVLDGDGPRFLQDQEDLVSESEPMERLLIESPGGSTIRNNTDLLVRRGRFTTLGRPAAAMALYTFQSWAPAGGAGNRTGLRGGGPLTTLVAPGGARTLWHLLWANVPLGEKPLPADLPWIFPWLAPTITSENARVVVPAENAHPLQCWWGMPRRIRLDFSPSDLPCSCGLTGTLDTVHVTGWRQRPRGVNYAGWGKIHPLTPHYTLKPGAEWLPVHPQPGGIGYRHWLGLVTESFEGMRVPAKSIADWQSHGRRARDIGQEARFLAAGYDMDNMKARAFVESEMPLPVAADADTRQHLDDLAKALVRAADQVAGLLRSAVRNALFAAGATVKIDAELLSAQRERLWEQTEQPFFAALRRIADCADPAAERAAWLAVLRGTALALFDEAAPLSPDASDGSATLRIVRARRQLVFALAGFGKEGNALFQMLGQPKPDTKAAKATRTSKGRSV